MGNDDLNEKVLNLLNLCLTAKQQGIFIWFSYSPHIDAINICAFKEGWETVLPDETPDKEFDYRIYLDWEDAEKWIAEAERSIKELMEERISQTRSD